MFILVAFVGGPLAVRWVGHGPKDLVTGGVDNFVPSAPVDRERRSRRRTTHLVLGASDLVGRDEFLRLLAGAQVSLEVGILSTIVGLTLGLVPGLLAGSTAAWTDTLVSRLTEIVMAFPLLLFLIALGATLGDRLDADHARRDV